MPSESASKEAFAAREAELERAALAALDDALDVTAARATALRRGRLHPTDPDPARSRGHLPWASATRSSTAARSRPSGTTSTRSTSQLTHPSRSHRDTFYVDDETLLRTHTSTGQIRVDGRDASRRSTSPRSAVSTGVTRRARALRRTSTRSRRSPSTADITLADLKGTLMHFFRAMFGEDRDVRMRTSFFPFTEPSVEFDVTCFLCGGKAVASCKYTGWFEMGGAGVVDPRVFENVGLRPRGVVGIRVGVGPRPHRARSVTASPTSACSGRTTFES